MVQDSRVPRADRQELLAIAVGGAAGALLRVLLARTYTSGSASWPWATFAANMAGALVLGYAVTRLQERLPLSAYRRPLIGTGFCGALTTFSTMQLELLHMLDAHRYGLAAAYATTSIVAGYACVHVASALVRRVRVIA
jgi:CrcB protein